VRESAAAFFARGVLLRRPHWKICVEEIKQLVALS